MTAPLELTIQQLAAYDTLSAFVLGRTDSAMAVLRGAAGTGKTFLASRVIQTAVDAGLVIAIAAPTNKAVRVLREKMVDAGIAMPDESVDSRQWGYSAGRYREDDEQISFGSIQGMLGMRMRENADGKQDCKQERPSRLHKFDVVVVDECSMIGMDLFEKIVQAKQNTRILFVGDPLQLPPIGIGDTTSPTFQLVSLDVSLNEIIRQQADNPIINLARRIRIAVESGERMTSRVIRETLPPIEQGPHAAFIAGGYETIVQYMLAEIKEGRNARVIVYHDKSVQRYNQWIHEALHGGPTEYPFVVGQRVIVDKQCNATPEDDDTGSAKLITSEEATVTAIRWEQHPYYRDIAACHVTLERDGDSSVTVFVVKDQAGLDRMIGTCFERHRALKAASQQAMRIGEHRLGAEHAEAAKEYSDAGWGLLRSFAPLRHAYAMTSHKSQGSTFDTVFVDFADFARLSSNFTFNRSLYVAITRPSKFLAIVSSLGDFA